MAVMAACRAGRPRAGAWGWVGQHSSISEPLDREFHIMAFRPFEDTQFSLGNLQDEMNKLFERLWHAGVAAGPFDGQKWAPFLDLHEYADRYAYDDAKTDHHADGDRNAAAC